MATDSNILAGKALVEVGIKAENMQKFFNEWGKRASAFGQKLSAAGRRMAVSSIVMSIPAVAGVKAFAKFSKEMAFVSTMVDNTQKHMGKFTEEVHKMSVEFGQSTNTMTRGLYDILSAGFDASQAISMLKVTSRAAVAGMTDTAASTKAIIAVLNAYGLSAANATEVADTLFQTVRYGVLTFGELAGHIGLVAPSAAQAGVNLDELGVALAVITRSGIETSHAVVALNNILKAFMAPTGAGADFAKKLKEAGFAFDLSIKGIKDAGFINILKAIGRLPTESIAKLFPSIRSQRGILAIKSGLSSVTQLMGEFANKTGSMYRAFSKVCKSFGFLLDQVKQAGMLILVHFGEAVAGNIEKMGKGIVRIATGVGNWIKANKDLIRTYVKVVAALAVLSLSLMAIAKVLTAIAMISAFISALAGPSGLARVGLALAAAAIVGVTLYKTLKSIKEEIEKIGEIADPSLPGGDGKKGGTPSKAAQNLVKLEEKMVSLKERQTKIHAEHQEAFAKMNEERASGAKKVVQHMMTVGHPEIIGESKAFDIAKEASDVSFQNLKYFSKAIPALEKKIALAKKELEIEKKRLALSGEANQAEENRLAMLSGAAKFAHGGFAGFFHTRGTMFSTTESKEDRQTDILGKIQVNTESTAAQLKDGIAIRTT